MVPCADSMAGLDGDTHRTLLFWPHNPAVRSRLAGPGFAST